MTGDAKRQGLVYAAAHVAEIDVEVVDGCGQRHVMSLDSSLSGSQRCELEHGIPVPCGAACRQGTLDDCVGQLRLTLAIGIDHIQVAIATLHGLASLDGRL